MSSKKNKNGGAKRGANSSSENAKAKKAPAKKRNNKGLIIATVVVVAVIGVIVASGGLGAKDAGALTPTPEEAKYLGRLLPEGYVEPKVGEGGEVTRDIPMSQIQVSQTEAGLTFPVGEVVSKRNVGFSYTKGDGTPVALIAFVKPSGKLFVAVSFCVPCKGTSHTMTSDGNMTCDACGTKRDIETAVGVSGACKLYPMDELPVTITGDQITIEKSVLDNWTEQPADRQVG